jgi:hypothetical protein
MAYTLRSLVYNRRLLLLIAIGIGVAAAPAIRAIRVDPAATLRQE